jgi:hypothetical protein
VAKPKPRVIPPFRGAANNTAFIKTPGDLAPLDTMRNFRTFVPDKDRPQGGKRPGIVKAFDRQLKNAAVQALCPVSRASYISGYLLGDGRDMGDGSSKDSDALEGNLFILDEVPSMRYALELDALQYGGLDAQASNAVAFHPDDDLIAFAINIPGADTVSGFGETVIRVVTTDGAVLWTIHVTSAFADRYTNTLVFSRHFLFVCVADHVRMYRVSDGSDFGTAFLGAWASETVEADVYRGPGGTEFLYVAFNGANKPGDLVGGGSIIAGPYAIHFRSGIIKYRLIYNEGQDGYNPLVQVSFGTAPDPADPLIEDGGFHGYWRVSEQSGGKPWGCLINAMRVSPADGSVFFARTNQGYGPNTLYHPDGSTAFVTVTKVLANGTLAWERDTDSIDPGESGALGFANDIPTAPGDEPAILAVAVDGNGDVYAGGRRNILGDSVFKLRGTDGVMVWTTTVAGIYPKVIRQAAMAIDPTDGNLVVAGDRNNDWIGADGQAHLWKISGNNGTVLWSFDILSNVSGLGVDVSTLGQIAYVTDFVS